MLTSRLCSWEIFFFHLELLGTVALISPSSLSLNYRCHWDATMKCLAFLSGSSTYFQWKSGQNFLGFLGEGIWCLRQSWCLFVCLYVFVFCLVVFFTWLFLFLFLFFSPSASWIISRFIEGLWWMVGLGLLCPSLTSSLRTFICFNCFLLCDFNGIYVLTHSIWK